MKKKRRSFTERFKAEVALEAVRSMKTLAELATEYQVHPNQILKWKKHLVAHASELYFKGASKNIVTEEELTAPLYEEIGRLKMDVKWLKKKF